MKFPITTVTALLGAAASAAVLATATPASAQQTRYQAQYCGALASFHADVHAFQALGPDAPPQAVRSVTRRIRDDADNVKDATSNMQSPAARDFDHAADRLRRDYDSLGSDITGGQAREQLQGDVQNLRSAARELASESNCPQMGQQQEEQPYQQQEEQPYQQDQRPY